MTDKLVVEKLGDSAQLVAEKQEKVRILKVLKDLHEQYRVILLKISTGQSAVGYFIGTDYKTNTSLLQWTEYNLIYEKAKHTVSFVRDGRAYVGLPIRRGNCVKYICFLLNNSRTCLALKDLAKLQA